MGNHGSGMDGTSHQNHIKRIAKMTIYIDPLGRPSAQATVSLFGDNYGKDGHYSLTSVSNTPEMVWTHAGNSHDVSVIVDELTEQGWDCDMYFPHHGRPPSIRCTHLETAAALEACKVTLVGDGEHGYIRYGSCPKSGYSINHATGEPEKGVSVYEAVFFGNGYQVSCPHYSTGTFESVRAQGRPVYRIWGDVVGHGSDGEPVLKVQKTKKIS